MIKIFRDLEKEVEATLKEKGVSLAEYTERGLEPVKEGEEILADLTEEEIKLTAYVGILVDEQRDVVEEVRAAMNGGTITKKDEEHCSGVLYYLQQKTSITSRLKWLSVNKRPTVLKTERTSLRRDPETGKGVIVRRPKQEESPDTIKDLVQSLAEKLTC